MNKIFRTSRLSYLTLKQKIEISICIAFIFFSYISHLYIWAYPDTQNFNVWSKLFWNAVFDGKITIFYDYCAQEGIFCEGLWSTFFTWNLMYLPIWIINRTRVIIPDSICVLYSKTILYIFVIALLIFVYKILLFMTNNDKVKALFLSVFAGGSLELLNSVGYAGQDEIIYILYYLIGLYCLIRNRRTIALIFFTFSVTACPIMIIPIVCQYLIYQKSILKIVLFSLVLVFPSAAYGFLYRNDVLYQSLKNFNTVGTFQSMLNTGTISTSIGGGTYSICNYCGNCYYELYFYRR